jgi:DNA-binding winged helix-turn-helix (wHTH) protein/Flp pilus assembly protein TadD
MTPRDTNAAFSAGTWQAYPKENRLVDGDRVVSLEPRVMSVLICLRRNPGRIVSTDELLDEVWGRRAHGDHTVYQAIADLRKALCDDASNPRYIETIPKRGYRLICSVMPIGDVVRVDAPRKRAKACRPWRNKSAILVASLSTLTVAVILLVSQRTPGNRAATDSTAELTAYDYYLLGVGHHDEYSLSSLNQSIKNLNHAIAADPTFAQAYAALARTLADLYWFDNDPKFLAKAEAAAQHALRIDALLSEAHWSMGYVQLERGQYSSAIEAYSRAIELDPYEVRAYAHLADAFAESSADFDRAVEILEQGLQSNPNSAQLYNRLAWFSVQRGASDWEEALNYLQIAMEVEPDYPHTYYKLTMINWLKGQPAQTINYGEKAYKLNAAFDREDIGAILADTYITLRDFTAAADLIEDLRNFNPDSFVYTNADIHVQLAQGRVTNAVSQIHQSIPKHIHDENVLSLLAFYELLVDHTEHSAGLYGKLIENSDSESGLNDADLLRLNELSWGTLGAVNYAYLKINGGDTDGAQRYLQMSREFLETNNGWNVWVRAGSISYIRSQIAALENETDVAFEYLREAIANGWSTTWYARIDPALGPLHSDARFTKMMEGVERNARSAAYDADKLASLNDPPHQGY